MGCGASKNDTRSDTDARSFVRSDFLGENNNIMMATQSQQGADQTRSAGADAEDPGGRLSQKSSSSQCSCSRDQCNGELLEDTAVVKLQLLLRQLERGQVPQIAELKKVVRLASEALTSHQQERVEGQSDEERLECVRDKQVREWLSVTFTRMESVYDNRVNMTPILRFKAAANTIIISHYLGNISPCHQREVVAPSQPVLNYLQGHIDDWKFDIFELDRLSEGGPFRHVGHHLLRRHNLFERCQISDSMFDCFLTKIEEGYNHHGNPYHNACHGADVALTLHYFLQATGVKAVLSDIELLSVIIAALIHDVHHPGTTNGFQINRQSEYALLYNDRSVLENHHLYYTFKALQDHEANFLKSLCAEDYKLLRGLVVEMVLATDMSTHFAQLKQIRHVLSQPEVVSLLQGVERAKALGLLLHMADISHPGKPWHLHLHWTQRLAEEFHKQGDEEKRLGLPVSPLCDRETGNLATSQIGFIEHIVCPSYELCGDLLETLSTVPSFPQDDTSSNRSPLSRSPVSRSPVHVPASPSPSLASRANFRVWKDHLTENIAKWKLEEKSATIIPVKESEVKTSESKEGSEVILMQVNHSRSGSDTTTITIHTMNGEGGLVSNHN